MPANPKTDHRLKGVNPGRHELGAAPKAGVGVSWMPGVVTYDQAVAAAVAEQPRLVTNGTGGRVMPADQHFGT